MDKSFTVKSGDHIANAYVSHEEKPELGEVPKINSLHYPQDTIIIIYTFKVIYNSYLNLFLVFLWIETNHLLGTNKGRASYNQFSPQPLH